MRHCHRYISISIQAYDYAEVIEKRQQVYARGYIDAAFAIYAKMRGQARDIAAYDIIL